MEYTRSLFISLLEENFGEVLLTGGRYHLKAYENKKVAEILDYSDKQFGNCLNPSNNTSYKTVIKRLLKHGRIKSLEQELLTIKSEKKTLIQENKNLVKEKGQSQALSKWLLVGIFSSIMAITILLMWLPFRIEQTVTAFNKNTSKKYVVRTSSMFDNIMQFEGSVISYRMALRGLLLNEKIRKLKTPITEDQREELILETKQNVKEILKEARIRFYSMGFVTMDGRNLADILEVVTPHEDIYTDGDGFSASLKRLLPYLFNENASLLETSDQIIKATKQMQHGQWEEMKKNIRFED